MTTDGLRLRHASRALVLDRHCRVLLARFDFPVRTVWALPGGGVEPGESHDEALSRELTEELGLSLAAAPDSPNGGRLGAELWERTHIFTFLNAQWDGQVDRAWLVHVDSFDPRPEKTWDELRGEWMGALEWWTLAEVIDAAADGVFFAPRRLPALMAEILQRGAPPRALRFVE